MALNRTGPKTSGINDKHHKLVRDDVDEVFRKFNIEKVVIGDLNDTLIEDEIHGERLISSKGHLEYEVSDGNFDVYTSVSAFMPISY